MESADYRQVREREIKRAAQRLAKQAARKGNLAEFLAASPVRRSGLKLKRLPLRLRRLEL